VLDDLTGTYLILANGSAQLPDNSGFHIAPSLQTAEVKTSLVLTDSKTGTSIPVVIDAKFAGVGDPFSQRVAQHNVGPNYILNYRVYGRFSFATASGTVTITIGTTTTTYNLGQAIYTDVLFGATDEGSITITRQ
jgi:hypothetical protein